jgi:hypothetical protein
MILGLEDSKIGFVKLLSYKRIGRVYSIDVLRKIVEGSKSARKSKSED